MQRFSSGLIVSLIVAVALAGCGSVRLPPGPGTSTGIEACRMPESMQKAGATLYFDWSEWVEQDETDAAVVFARSGNDFAVCEASRNVEGTFGGVVSKGFGFLEGVRASQLTYDTNLRVGSSTAIAVAGRAPVGTAEVEVTSDAVHVKAALRDGLYVARLQSATAPTEIIARGANGEQIARLARAGGELEPPAAS